MLCMVQCFGGVMSPLPGVHDLWRYVLMISTFTKALWWFFGMMSITRAIY